MRTAAAGIALALVWCAAAAAPVPAPIEALDGPALTCIGAERAGSASGVAEYSGKWLGRWPGLKNPGGYDPGPYADEKPLFTITAANLAEHAERLTDGQKALLRRYPDYRIPVYPSHRDFRLPDWACTAVRHNAAHARLVHDGLGVTGQSGAIPFPFPATGLEAIWNVLRPTTVWNETATFDIAGVFASGAVNWGRMSYQTLIVAADPAKRGDNQDPAAAYFLTETLLPQRDRGSIGVGFQPNDFADGSTHVWAYSPGTRRLRQAPDIAFDYPTPPSGLRTVDDDHAFNGSPERYEWTLLGKREIYVPYHNFRVNDPALPYQALLGPHSLNPDYLRYELHRVWVIEGRLKPGFRHIYGRRVIYADEDTWMAPLADNYDMRGELYRVALITFRYAPDAQAFHRGVSVYHDLTARAYEAGYLVNEAGSGWWRLNRTDLRPQMFSPQAAVRRGH
ncbi:DUF1329 domain-containing protein [Fontimonas sp. SYSU GA230001]|uniref:DUF1329 domain-containing protein n=1 Tax=Fontimonas sp. SYSU GA230001 TaxID=3142450 RepID=UPI0032B3B72C